MDRQDGFTLIEILVVLLVIGILVAMAIPSFLTQTTKAGDVEAKSSLSTAQAAMETYATDHDGKYTGASAADLRDVEPTLADAAGLVVGSAGAEAFEVSITSKAKGATRFTLHRKSDGTVSRTCDRAGQGGCRAGGVW